MTDAGATSAVSAAMVLAVGPGPRGADGPGILRRVGGVTLLERAVRALRDAGIERIVVVAGHQADRVGAAITSRRLPVEVVEGGGDGDECSASSAVLTGLRVLGVRRCLIVAGNAVFEPEDVRAVIGAGTPNAMATVRATARATVRTAERAPDGQVKIQLQEDGSVVALGTDLARYDALDAGLTVVDVDDLLSVASGRPRSWLQLRQSLATIHQLQAVETSGLCACVDTPAGVRAAERRMWRRYGPKPIDSIIARVVYRRISGPITRLLLHTSITPDAATAMAFVVTLAAAALVATGHPWLMPIGGIGVVLGCALDGVDGELARISGTASRRGATLDTLLDRYADLAVVLALVLAAGGTETAWAVGFGAAAGCLLVSYVHAVGRDTDVRLLFRREFRLLILAVAAVIGLPAAGLIAVAVTANADALRGVVLLLRAMRR